MNCEEFISKAKIAHGDKYDYSKIKYINNKTKVCIICHEHGYFWQRPDKHLFGQGCPKCAGKGLTTEEIINKFKHVHGNKYDYSKVTYTNSHTKICIICHKHGELWQTPNSHLNGDGCKKCSKKLQQRSNLERAEKARVEFIEKAKKVHGDKYDYSKVEYINNHAKVCIICPKHGEFWQKPNNHLNGQGCPICNESHLERSTAKYLNHINVIYEREKNWWWLKNKRPLHVDFYLPSYNTVIECQGKQHFKENVSFGSKSVSPEDLYEYVKTIDSIKYNLCKEHNIRIEYINYNDNVENRINEIINKYKNKDVVVTTPPVSIDK